MSSSLATTTTMTRPLFRDEDFVIGQAPVLQKKLSAVTNELLPTAISVWMNKLQGRPPLISGIMIFAALSLTTLLQKTTMKLPWTVKNQRMQCTNSTTTTSETTIQEEQTATANSAAIISPDANLLMNGYKLEEGSKSHLGNTTSVSEDDFLSTAGNVTTTTTTSKVVAHEEEQELEDQIIDSVHIDDTQIWIQKYEDAITELSKVQTQLERTEHELIDARSALETWQSQAQYWETMAKEQESQFQSTLHMERKRHQDQILQFKDAMIEIVQSEKKELMEQFQKQLQDFQETVWEQDADETEEGDCM
jgi:hypothetical protein